MKDASLYEAGWKKATENESANFAVYRIPKTADDSPPLSRSRTTTVHAPSASLSAVGMLWAAEPSGVNMVFA